MKNSFDFDIVFLEKWTREVMEQIQSLSPQIKLIKS